MSNTELPTHSSERLSPNLIFNPIYTAPEGTVAYIVEAHYGEICDRTIAEAVSAVDDVKKAQPLGENHLVLVSVNLNGTPQLAMHDRKARALAQAIEEQNQDTPVVLLMHTNEAEKIYGSLAKRGCELGVITPLFGVHANTTPANKPQEKQPAQMQAEAPAARDPSAPYKTGYPVPHRQHI